jgi:PRC-barrel domain
MLRSLKDLEHYTVVASDGDVGHVQEFLFDDERWVIRYAVAETGGFWMQGPRVLISPIAFREVNWDSRSFHVAMTRDKAKNSPSIDFDKPVSRQHECNHFDYYGYPYYWGELGLWGVGVYPSGFLGGTWNAPPRERSDKPADSHLRSASVIRAYDIRGSDDTIGHIDDLVVDDQTWQVRYLVVATSDWWLGKRVLVAPHWAQRISWEKRTVYLDLSRERIKNSPEWDPNAGVNREYEARIYDYYGRPVYWDNDHAAAE